MIFFNILFKTLISVLVNVFNKLLNFARFSNKENRVSVGVLSDVIKSPSSAKTFLGYFFHRISIIIDFSNLNKQLELNKVQENKYLLIIICWLFRINLDKDFEFILNKKFHKEFTLAEYANSEKPKTIDAFKLSNLNKNVYDSIENKVVNTSVNSVFNLNNKHISIENLFLHNKSSPVNLLTQDSALNINFKALEDFYSYLKMFGDEEKLSKYPAEIVFKSNPKIRKKERIPKNFRGGTISTRGPLPKSNISEKTLRHQVNILKQVEFLLKNKALVLSKKIHLKNIDIHAEVKSVMYSYYNPVGPYGNDTIVYSGDLVSKNKLIVSRRLNLIKDETQIKDLKSFVSKVGFFNFNSVEDEEWETSSDIPSIGGWFTGQFYFINPFLVLGFVAYSIFELFMLLYVMSFFFGNPYDNVLFFFKYPLVYYYENLTVFPSPNFFFFSLIFWFLVFLVFSVHILQLLDEDRFEPPRLSWVYNFFKDFFYNIFLWWCVLFCLFEVFSFADLLFTRIFFIGTPGYPQLLAGIFLIFYDLIYLLGTIGYFSFYLESFMHLDIKFPAFYFSDYTPFLQRYPLVQPYFIGDPYLNRPNLFLWIFDIILGKFSGESSKTAFFSQDIRYVFQRELVQDFRKYNFIRKNLLQLRTIGQLYNRGWNGFNFRLDLQVISDPIISTEQIIRFDWRFKNSHTEGLHSRLFKPAIRFGSTTRKEPVVTLKLLSGRRRPSRHGYLDYLRTIENDSVESKYLSWEANKPSKYRKPSRSSKLKILSRGMRKSAPFKNTRIRTFLFRPSKAKFRLLLSENLPLQTKADRNFRNSRLFFRRHFNFWSYVSGNSKPHRKSYYKPFLSFQQFSGINSLNYAKKILYLNQTVGNRHKLQSQIVNPYLLRNAFFKSPSAIFSTEYVNQTIPFFNNEISKIFYKNASLYNQGLNKIASNSSNLLPLDVKADFVDNFSHNRAKNFQKSKNFLFNKSSTNLISELQNKNEETKKRFFRKRRGATRTPRYQRLRKKRIKISAIPGYPFQSLKKFHFISTFLSNFEPKYFLRPTATFTTFSKINRLYFKRFEYTKLPKFNFPIKHNSGLLYPFGLLFSGFGKLTSMHSQFKFINFDYYYSQNHNFFYSFMDFYLKKNQFRSLPTSNARFKHPLNGGLRYNLDFLYPMISELRLKEKIIPIDFFYDLYRVFNYKFLRLDPYEKIRNFKYSKGSCYLLDTKIQNWLNFNNVIWNDYYHFFFSRSFKTEGNGLKFCLASFNPINGPQSYKLFIGSPTLEIPKVGQFFYNYIPWLQYKFKWLLYPTSSYKRFDSFRAIHQHSNKKFYFTSLLKFYQMNLFRWQQAAQIYQWNFVQTRNFMIHLFFHKYNFLKHIQEFNNLFMTKKQKYPPLSNIYSDEISIPEQINNFNFFFFSELWDPQKIKKRVPIISSSAAEVQDIFVPSFTGHDFRFFQYAIDLRRWKALQSSYVRDWKFETYIKYLGPLIYKEDVPSLMGFFAPFEYRNQIFVSRMRNDSLRFSIFFPKKIIDEQYTNPLKRLKFPYPRVSRAIKSTGARRGLPSFYAYVINRPFVLNTPNYSFFSKKGKKVLHGFYPHLKKFNLSSDLNLNYGHGFNDSFFLNIQKSFSDLYYGFFDFFDLSMKKKRILKDKNFWLSKNYELQDIRERITFWEHAKPGVFSKILNQLGTPYNLDVSRAFGKINTRKNLDILVDLNSWKKNKALKIVYKNAHTDKKIKALLYPYIFRRFGGPKVNSKHWHKGQSWMKFVIATQNVSTRPKFNPKLNSSYKPLKPRSHSRIGMKNLIYSNAFLNTQSTLRSQYSALHKPMKQRQYGFFNFGLSGIGRLPRLSRAFFHMLFFRNKLDDFKNLKIYFLKIYLMSLPLFHNSELQYNSSFKFFWSTFLGRNGFKNLKYSLRYNVLIGNFFENKYNPQLSTYVYHPFLGSLVSYYSFLKPQDNTILVLNNQYNTFKAFNKFIFFSDFIKLKLLPKKKNIDQIIQKTVKDDLVMPYPEFKNPKELIKNYVESILPKDPFYRRLFLAFWTFDSSVIQFVIMDHDSTRFKKNANAFLNPAPLSYYKALIRFKLSELNSFKNLFHSKLSRQYHNNNDNYLLNSFYFSHYFYYYNFLLGLLDFLNLKFKIFSFEFFNHLFINSFLFVEQSTKSLIYVNKKDNETVFLNKFLNNYSVLNFFEKYNTPYVKDQDLMRSRFYFGSFRSKLHWYFYPVQYFFSVRYFLFDNFSKFLYNSLNFGFFFESKYLIHFNFFDKNFLISDISNYYTYSFSSNLSSFSTNKINDLRSKSTVSLNASSDFLTFYKNIYSRFFSLSSQSDVFVVRLNHRFFDHNFIATNFLYRNMDQKFFKSFVTFNTFFFSLEHLVFLYKFDNFICFNLNNYSKINAVNYIFDFEKFVSNLEFNSRSIDGSGRHNRPKTASQTLDKIFTYREYEKYRKEHHRQRFRGISPHWIQTSFKNRANFKRYYQSTDFVKKRATKRILNQMSKSFGFARRKKSIRRLRHITSLNSSINNDLLQQFLNRSIFNHNDNSSVLNSRNHSSSVNFVDTAQDGYSAIEHDMYFIRQKVGRAYNYNSIIRNDRDVDHYLFRKAKKSLKRKKYRYDKFKRFRIKALPFRHSVDSKIIFRKLGSKSLNVPYKNIRHKPKDFSFINNFFKKTDINKRTKKNHVGAYTNLENLQKLPIKSQINDYLKNLTITHDKSHKKPLKYVIPQLGGNTKKGGSFINVRRPSKLRNIFTTYSSGKSSWNYKPKKSKKMLTSSLIKKIDHDVKGQNSKNLGYFKRKTKLLFSGQRHDGKVPHFLERKKKRGGSVGFRYPQHKTSLNAVSKNKHQRYSPKYLGSVKVDKRKLGFYKDGLPKTNLGGINKSSRSNYFMYDQRARKKPNRIAGKLRKHHHFSYAPNVKRFVRKHNRVLMHIPYVYSKWFTQNPRLSHSVDNSFLNIFLNNQYDEFKLICMQSLFLLKRKIMYNIVSLKLLTQKHKVLYFSTLHLKDEQSNYLIKSSIIFKVFKHISRILKVVQAFFLTFNTDSIFNFLYLLRQKVMITFFSNDVFFIRLLYNPQISRFRHDSNVMSDFIFFEDFYYKQTAKRILSQIAFSGHSLGGWNNPLGLVGQYIPGLNFYAKGSIFFNFNYQYPDFYSGRSFSPEIMLDNNLLRQNSDLFDRNFFYNEFYVGSDYRRSWHYLSFRLFSPISPFIEYERVHNLNFKNIVKRRHKRLPLSSLRRIYNIYPDHLASFFSTLMADSSTIVGHDATFPFKLKLLNYKIRANPEYRRELTKLFKANSFNTLFSGNIYGFYNALKLKHLSVLSDFHKRMNLSSLTNNRRFALKHNVWSPFKYNYYYRLNWKTFLHKYSYLDEVGYRQYKLSSFFDLYQGNIPFSLKLRALQHLIVSQIPRFEIDSRRRVPLNISLKEFSLLFFNYFKYVSENFSDPGHDELGRKIFKYANRKIHPFLYSYLFDKNDNFLLFKTFYNPLINYKKFLNSNVFLKPTTKLSLLQIPEYFTKKKLKDPSIYKSILSISKQKILSSIFFVFSENPFGFRTWLKENFFLFNFSNYTTSKINYIRIPWYLPRLSSYTPQNAYDKYRAFSFWSRFGRSRHKVSRIFGIHTLHNMKIHKERFLNPSTWLKFDLFSRIRPSFKPFVTKFSKNFVFSKYVPARGISSYNYEIKSHTSFDNYFDKHPYISFAIGLGSDNYLIHSESSYKEIKRRSQMLDFARSHNSSKGLKGNILHHINRQQRRHVDFMDTYNYSSKKLKHKKKHPYKRLLSTISFRKPKFRKRSFRFNFEALARNRYNKENFRENHNQLGSRFILLFDKPFSKSYFGNYNKPLEGSSLVPRPNAETFEDGLSLEYLRQHHPHNYIPYFGRKRNSNILLKDSTYFSNMSNPNRRAFFLNTLLLRPNNSFLKFVRSDNYIFFKNKNFNSFFSTVGSFNDLTMFRNRSYNSPNFKISFDFNAFKQRYNLGLLFRDLSFERDFELFLFQRNNIYLKPLKISYRNGEKTSLLASEFTKLNFFDFFEFFYPKKHSHHGFIVDSSFNNVYFLLEKFFLKINPLYMLMVMLDFYLFCFFNLLTLFTHMYIFNFSLFYNLFNFDLNTDFFFYTKKRPAFQIFFHFGLFQEYIRLSWLFNLKFLIFNIEYYPYYFFIFSFILIMRTLSFNLQRLHLQPPFLVPYMWRFSDFKLNSYNGWFDSAWTEIKTEALNRLHELHYSSRIQLSHDHLFSLQDIKNLRKRHLLKNKKYLIEFDEPDIDLSGYDNVSVDDVLFSKPVTISPLKGSMSKIRSINLITPSFLSPSSDNLKQLDSDMYSKSDIGLNSNSELLFKNSIVKKEASTSFVLFKKLLLVLTRKITFSQFLSSFKFGDFIKILQDGKPFFNSTNYTVDDFGDEFGKLFIDPDSEFNSFINRKLKKRRMLPDDENIHFYRKPGSILHTEIMSRKYGTESDQLHYVVEFPGKFNNTYINTFSKTYSVRNLNHNISQAGFFSFSKSAILPTTFEEFLIFCSYTQEEASIMLSFSKDPYNTTQNPNLNRLQELWSLFQYVTKYEYNMFNEYNTNDVKLLDKFFDEQTTLFDNFKFWVNKASTNAIDFNFFNNNFLLVDDSIEDEELELVGGENLSVPMLNDQYDISSIFAGENPVGRIDSSPFFSFLYIFHVYLFLFLFFLFISFMFCFLFLFLYSFISYVYYVL